MKLSKRGFSAFLLFFITALSGYGQGDSSSLKFIFPLPEGWVNDFENDLESVTITKLQSMIALHRKKAAVQIALITIPSYEPYNSMDAYACDVSSCWGVCSQTSKNGVMIVLSQEKNEVRINVGKGLHKRLSDVACQKVIHEKMYPKFKQGNYDQGILDGVAAIIQLLEKS